MKLSDDHKYSLYELLLSDGYHPLLHVLEEHVRDMEDATNKYNLKDGVQGLVETKARAEGARRLAHNLTKFLEEFKNRHRRGE